MKNQEEVNKALEMPMANEEVLHQQVQDLEWQLQQAKEEHHMEKEAQEVEIQKIKAHNEELIRDKERITQDHLKEAYRTNLHLHRRSTQLEDALQGAERLIRERAQQIRELEEIPKIPVSLDDQLEMEH